MSTTAMISKAGLCFILAASVALSGAPTLAATKTKAVTGATLEKVAPFGQPLLWYKVTGFDYPSQVVESSHGVMYAVHSTSYWDSRGMIAGAVEKSLAWSHRRKLPVFTFASKDEVEATDIRGSHVIPYEGDSHFLAARGEPSIYFVGGNFSQCLCNAARSSIVHHSFAEPLNLWLVTDAIYENKIPSTANEVFLKSARKDYAQILAEILASMSDQEVLNYFEVDWLKKSDQLPCPEYEPSLLTPLKPSYRYQIFRGPRMIGILGTGNNLVNIHLISVQDLH